MVTACLAGLALVSACDRRDKPQPGVAASSNISAEKPGELLALGSPLPAVTATAHTGETVRMQELKGKPVIVYFYPKDDTPGCSAEAQEIRDLWTELQKAGALVVGVSSDDAASHRAFADKYALPFLLLPDEDQRIASAFNVPVQNGRARRVSFVFGADGKLSRVFPAVNPRGHGKELLAALQ